MKVQFPTISKDQVKKTSIKIGLISGLTVSTIIGANAFFMENYLEFQSPIVFRTPVLVHQRAEIGNLSIPTVEAVSTATESAKTTIETEPVIEEKEQITELVGEASYYSESGCLGCSPTLTMANGERLDDSKLTMALVPDMYRKYKNMNLKVTNNSNGKSAIIKVTDSGGFAKYNRVADLSLATKEMLGCKDICQVTISLPEEVK